MKRKKLFKNQMNFKHFLFDMENSISYECLHFRSYFQDIEKTKII